MKRTVSYEDQEDKQMTLALDPQIASLEVGIASR
jgi:hypothetical protein